MKIKQMLKITVFIV